MSDKTCKNCERELPFTAFNKKRSTKDGYNNYCRVCVNSKTVTVEYKTCQTCEVEKPATDFHKMKSSEDGLHPYCKMCKKAYAAKLYSNDKERIDMVKAKWRDTFAEKHAAEAKEKRDFNRKFLQDLKASTPCTDCKNYFDPICMDFDHLPHEKKSFTISQVVQYSLELLLAEVEKCEIVCANCHRIRTRDRRLGESSWVE